MKDYMTENDYHLARENRFLKRVRHEQRRRRREERRNKRLLRKLGKYQGVLR